jgi:hypothetical protein
MNVLEFIGTVGGLVAIPIIFFLMWHTGTLYNKIHDLEYWSEMHELGFTRKEIMAVRNKKDTTKHELYAMR